MNPLKGFKSKSKSKAALKRKSPAVVKTRYRLTVSADKLAVLLRLPRTTIKIIDDMAAENSAKRTTVLYEIIGAHPRLAESMQGLLAAEQNR